MTLYLLRHGETELNRTDRLQGRVDEPLNRRGAAQARECAARLAAAGLRFDKVIASPLDRAIRTAELVTGLPRDAILVDERITEIDYGPWETLPFERIDAEMMAFLRDPDHVPAPAEMESIPHLMDRTGDFLHAMAQDPAEKVLAVTHGVAIRAILGHLLGKHHQAVWGMPVENCVVYAAERRDGRFLPAKKLI